MLIAPKFKSNILLYHWSVIVLRLDISPGTPNETAPWAFKVDSSSEQVPSIESLQCNCSITNLAGESKSLYSIALLNVSLGAKGPFYLFDTRHTRAIYLLLNCLHVH